MNLLRILPRATLALAAAIAAGAPAARAAPAAASAAAPAAASAPQQAPQLRRVALAQGLYELVYSPRQKAVFAASSGGWGEGSTPSRILRLNPDTLAVESETELPRRGFGLALDDAANRLYVGNTTDASITVIDTATGQVVGTVQLAEKVKAQGADGKEEERYPHNFRQLVLDPANHRLYAPGLSFQDSALYVVDTRKLQVEQVLPGFGFVATGIALDPQHARLYVSNLQGQLRTVDTRTLAVGQPVEIDADQPLNLVLDSRRQRLLATDQGMERLDGMRQKLGGLEYKNRGEGNRVVVLDPATGKLLHSVPTGKGPVALLLDEPRGRLYVTNRESGTVSVLDADDYRVLHTIGLPTHPNSLALDAATGTVFVSVKNGQNDPKGSDESVARVILP